MTNCTHWELQKSMPQKYVVLPVETNKQKKNQKQPTIKKAQKVNHTFIAVRFNQFQSWVNSSSLDKTAHKHTNKHLKIINLVTDHCKPKEEPNVSWNRIHPIEKVLSYF